VIVIFFVVLPLLPGTTKEKYRLLDYIAPSRLLVATTISLFLLNRFVLYLADLKFHTNPGLEGNLSEFEELMTYYAIMLYVSELSRQQKSLPLYINKAARLSRY